MNAILVLALKDLRLLLRDRAALFWIVGFPALFALFLASVMQTWSGRSELALTVTVVDHDRSPAARRFLAQLARNPSLRTHEQTFERASEQLGRGELDALLEVLPGFGASADWHTGGIEVLRIGADPSRRREALLLRGVLLEAGLAEAVELELTRDPRASIGIVERATGARAPSAYELVTPLAVLWALVGSAAAFAISIAVERQRGTLLRLCTLPIHPAQILAGKALACWTVCMALALSMLSVAKFAFGVRLGQPVTISAVIAALAACFTGLMAAISTFGKSERSVAGAGWASLLLLAMAGGVMAPRMIMPVWLNAIGDFSPVRWGVVALETALWRGGGLDESLAPCIRLCAVGLAGLALGAVVLRRSQA